jgi:lipoprotein-anchoring transpeptidase ErfK/SrfK
MKKKFLIFPCIFLAVCFLTISVKADGFDAAYYARKYPDVAQALGNDPTVLYNHYLAFGEKEGRFQNQQEEIASLNAAISGNTAAPTAAPAQAQPQASGTYIDVNIAQQTVTYFVNGEAKLSTPCVTGNTSAGNGTPTGTYAITGEVPGKFLKGPTWNVWVDRWMPFNGNIGLHDAKWRSNFGGEIYQTSGSHGCVNLPHDAAVALYDMISVGTPVIVH